MTRDPQVGRDGTIASAKIYGKLVGILYFYSIPRRSPDRPSPLFLQKLS
ncbi:hypothetical protein [Oxynema aestuarii]|uniref:Uncharacterized protein n=1 Tax=Oxynema aestuarii AP17 TaxID=2064643 RepID=A0A6H1U1Q3_9CYAN|nr:hypothetical protein [Oxynema aestuarii]QIZ72376.1 hypothetical protein HCG48_18785 [Oxynema aestuarii AP17]